MRSPATERARELRNNMTKVGRFLWSRLRNRQVGGYKFRRQVPIGPYFADFACLSAHLIVEVDGEGHTQERDEQKTTFLLARGYRVVRIPVEQIDESIEAVMDTIFVALGAEL